MRSVVILAGLGIAFIAGAVGQVPEKAVPQKDSLPKATAKPQTQAATPVVSAQSSGQLQTANQGVIRACADAFVAAYNSANAKAISRLFLPDGEIVSEDGQSVQGRDKIEQVFADLFKQHPKTHMESNITDIRFIGSDMAIEEGTASVTYGEDEPAQRSPYSVTYLKTGGKWMTASARDFPDDASTPEEQLKQLAWMIGDWVDESKDALVLTSYRWSDNHCFIMSDFKVQVVGRPVMSGTQRIGWDPLTKTLHSWVFDSEGGFGEGTWSREGNQWIVKMNGVTHDGKSASSTNITTKISKDRMTWQQRDRIVGGEISPDLEAVTITRKPPMPQ